VTHPNRQLVVAALKSVVASNLLPTVQEFEEWLVKTKPEGHYNTDLESIGVLDGETQKLNDQGLQEFEDLVASFNKLSDPVELYRSICVPEYKDIDMNDLGIHWSLKIVNCGGDGYDKGEWGDAQFTLKAKVPKKNINWFATILHNLYWGEDEITTKNNIKIDVDEVIEGESPTAPSGQR